MRNLYKLLILGFLCTYISIGSQAQELAFAPHGNVYGRVFSNFHEGLLGEDQSSAFEITQAYFQNN